MSKTTRRARRKGEHEERFLAELGERCKKLRKSMGFSIHKLAKESEQLSTSVVQRLETGSGPITITSLLRYSEVLGAHPKDLLDIPFDPSAGSRGGPKILPLDHARAKKEAYRTLLPVYSLEAAAGYFGEGRAVEPEGWIEVKRSGPADDRLFIVKVVGHSMEPRLHDGAYAIFRAQPVGTRQGKIVLAQYRGPADPETGGSYTVKRYRSEKSVERDDTWRHETIRLEPINPRYKPLVLQPKDADDVRVLAELVGVVP